MAFPPVPVYPLALDSDRTLFVVYNTSETKLAANSQPWSQELEIEPVGADEDEIWADNGFANISGELFYYDAVEKDDNDKVFKFKRCARNLGGKKTQFNSIGTWVRGYVIAEHHNQLVQAILNLETFIGANNSDDEASLDFRIRDLDAEPTCQDDAECPDVTFEFEILQDSTNGCEGTTTSFNLAIDGFFKNFRIDFGDGNFTTSEQTGQHTYPPNSNIDPIVTVSNDKCQIVQTAIDRTNPEEPEIITADTSFDIDVPEAPDFPTIVIPNNEIPETTLTLPQIVFPCELGIGPIGPLNIPSIIVVSPPIPTLIEFGPVEIPDTIVFINTPSFSPIDFGNVPSFSPIDFGPAPSFSPIDFGPAPSFSPIAFGPAPSFSPITFGPVDIPTSITVTDDIPTTIVVTDDIPTVITVVDDIPTTINVNDSIPSTITVVDSIPSTITVVDSIPSSITLTGTIPSSISVTWGTPPSVTVNWGTPPSCSCTMTVTCPGSPLRAMNYNEEFADPFVDLQIDTQDIGLPSEIKIVAPTLPDIQILHNLPSVINVEVPHIPEMIKIIGPDIPIPSEIRIVGNTIPTQIEVISELPISILLDASQLPASIRLEVPDKMPEISIVGDIPKTIQVIGIPDTIVLKGTVPSEIILKPPEDFEIPLVYRGGPIPVQFDLKTPSGEMGEDQPCFALVPCGK